MKNPVLLYNPLLKSRARELRKNQTKAEELLWQEIRGKKIKGYQFIRQRTIASFIVDFVCLRLKLIIEVDGEIHLQNKDMDKFRQEQLELLGFRVLRFTNDEIEKDIKLVLTKIAYRMPE
ncbi:MAG: DUF559 domain-containing protein [Candidatus Taylorbacteria bacterium]|nr:DUF559 domain-containing protein [Candidatus Taylorbacteria bacterium]